MEMEWYIPPTQQEGSRQFHSYSNDRELTVMGLFGSFVIEPKGLIPRATGNRRSSADQKRLAGDHQERQWTGLPGVRAVYHEVGDEAFRPIEQEGRLHPQRDPLTDVYRPVARA